MPASQSDADLLRAAIEASGLSARRFAVDILIRDERTIRRWLATASPMPEIVREKLQALIQRPRPSRGTSPA